MRNNSLKYLSAILLIAIVVIILIISARQSDEDVIPLVEIKPEATSQEIQADWIVFSAPEKLLTGEFEIQMALVGSFEQIDVNWSHPATGQKDQHTLNQFVAGNSHASYKARADFGNLLAGKNDYEVVAWVEPEAAPGTVAEGGEEPDPKANWQPQSVKFTVDLLLSALVEKSPEMINCDSWPQLTESSVLELKGTLKDGVDAVYISSFNEKSGKASFTKLKKYQSGDLEFQYNADEVYDNLLSGENLYVIELINGEDNLIARKKLKIVSDKLTYADELSEMFGAFSKMDNGWYVSDKLAWFAFRPAYEFADYQVGEPNVILPRPTLMYTAKAAKNTPLCDYLNGINYEEEGVSYRGFSYETCQQFSRGVSVYDRFLSALVYEPFKEIHRTEYKFVEGKVSSAFLMIETGAMRETLADSLFTEAEGSFEGMAGGKRKYFIYQMLITEDDDYTDEKIGDIEVEMSEERRAKVEKIRSLISAHSGEEFMAEIKLK